MESIEQYQIYKESKRKNKEKHKVVSKQKKQRVMQKNKVDKLQGGKKSNGRIVFEGKEYADNYKNRVKYGLRPTKAQKSKEFKRRVVKLDSIVSKIVKKRDANNIGIITCITYWCSDCSKKISIGKANACHCIARWYYSHRWHLSNIWWWCVSCNKRHAQEHWIEFVQALKEKFWNYWRYKQRYSRHKKKPSIERMQDLYEKLKKVEENGRDNKYFSLWLYDVN